jgi:hypothetical protein
MGQNVLVILDGDDWSALFVNDRLVTQGHNISIADMAKHVPIGALERKCCSDTGIALLHDNSRLTIFRRVWNATRDSHRSKS